MCISTLILHLELTTSSKATHSRFVPHENNGVEDHALGLRCSGVVRVWLCSGGLMVVVRFGCMVVSGGLA